MIYSILNLVNDLLTFQDHKSQSIQAQKLAELSRSLNSKGIDLKIEYSPTLHDREIRSECLNEDF